ncbi:TlyA family RNA methyltransferase [Candidatus Saccharibacteria bacterium]|nr:TlyA family RNA methyltransferase [Candidatus Saccharibacteria bacterium]
MIRSRLDQALVTRGLVTTRSQAESYIRLGQVQVGGRTVTKPGYFITHDAKIELLGDEQFVSRAALKLKSVADKLGVDFRDKVVLDIGSSTGGFTQFALSRGAKKVIAVDVGTDQLHPKLRRDPRIELHEKTDIRDFITEEKIDIILADVSFISLREILPHVAKNLAGAKTKILTMVKPQFETTARVKNAGVIKNDTERRRILRDFEIWARQYFLISGKKDSEIAGATGNKERFYLLKISAERSTKLPN